MSEAEQVAEEATTDDGSIDDDHRAVSTRLKELGVTAFFAVVALGGWLYSTSKRGAKQSHSTVAAGVSAFGGVLIAYAAPVAAVALVGVTVTLVSGVLYALYRR